MVAAPIKALPAWLAAKALTPAVAEMLMLTGTCASETELFGQLAIGHQQNNRNNDAMTITPECHVHPREHVISKTTVLMMTQQENKFCSNALFHLLFAFVCTRIAAMPYSPTDRDHTLPDK